MKPKLELDGNEIPVWLNVTSIAAGFINQMPSNQTYSKTECLQFNEWSLFELTAIWLIENSQQAIRQATFELTAAIKPNHSWNWFKLNSPRQNDLQFEINEWIWFNGG